jgi:hypothetical protein
MKNPKNFFMFWFARLQIVLSFIERQFHLALRQGIGMAEVRNLNVWSFYIERYFYGNYNQIEPQAQELTHY